MENDVSETDGRYALLRYVWLEDGKMVNSLLVSEGYAKAAITPPDTLYSEQVLTLADEAHRRAWDCGPWFPKKDLKPGPVPRRLMSR